MVDVRRLAGKVALVTGAARGQGRSHAELLAAHGADVVLIDICRDIDSVPYSLASVEDLHETERLVRAQGVAALAVEADVRDSRAMDEAVALSLRQLGRIDVVVVNAGIIGWPQDELSNDPFQGWQDTLDVNLTGAWNTLRSVRPVMAGAGRGGSIVIVNSSNGLKGIGTDSAAGNAYTASKHALVGLARQWAVLLAENHIRVNSVHPTGVSTPMVHNAVMEEYFGGPLAPTNVQNLMPVDLIEPIDVSWAVLFLASDAARYVTGVSLPVDAGITAA